MTGSGQENEISHRLVMGGVLFIAFLLLTPLGVFNDWIPPETHKGYYSVTTIDAGDDAGYYAFLRSLFFDNDLDFFNELHYAHSEKVMPTGYVFNNWQMGQALLFLPFFIIGHLLATLYQAMGYPISVGGYSAPYFISTAVASVTFLFAGLVLVFKTLNSFIHKRFSLFVTLSIWLASPLIYFSFIRQRMAHTVEFFFAAVLIFVWAHFRVSKNPLRHAVLGSLLGFLCMTRVINIAFFALFAVDLLWSSRADLRSSATLKKLLVLSGAGLSGFFLVMLPQIVCWYQLNGVPFPPRHVKFAGVGLFDTSLLSLFEKTWTLFFSAQWGLLFSMPLIILAGVGLLLKSEWLKEVRPGLLAYLVVIFAVVILYPESSASYGHRHFISALPVFALGLGNLLGRISEASSKWRLWMVIVGCLSAILAQYFMIIHYKVTLPYNHPEFSLKSLGATVNVLSNHPDLLLRSTNFFNVLPHIQSWNYLDGLFLIVFPLFQLIGLMAVWFSVKWIEQVSLVRMKVFYPKFLLANIVVISILLLTIVLVSTPTKTQSEIRARIKYQETVKKGEEYIKKNEIKAARVAYTHAKEIEPHIWKPYFMIGQTWQAESKLEKANNFYRKALLYNPNHSQTMVMLGNNLNRGGELKNAEKMIRSAIRSWPQNIQAYDVLARFLVAQGKNEEATKWLSYAVQVKPNHGPAHINLAMGYHTLKQRKKSLHHLRRALELGMKGPAVDQIKSIIVRKEKIQ
jgi:Tfp pilus assembly protein PilF